MGQSLAGHLARIGRGREGGEDVIVEEVRERPMADVMEQAGDPERFDDEALARNGLGTGDKRGPERRVELAGPQSGLVHDPETVREP